jgi:hypothetical protein
MMHARHWIDPQSAKYERIQELMGSFLSRYRADHRSNFSRKLTPGPEASGLCQRA